MLRRVSSSGSAPADVACETSSAPASLQRRPDRPTRASSAAPAAAFRRARARVVAAPPRRAASRAPARAARAQADDREVREARLESRQLAHGLAHAVERRRVDGLDRAARLAREVLAVGAALEHVAARAVAGVEVAHEPEPAERLEVAVDRGDVRLRRCARRARRRSPRRRSARAPPAAPRARAGARGQPQAAARARRRSPPRGRRRRRAVRSGETRHVAACGRRPRRPSGPVAMKTTAEQRSRRRARSSGPTARRGGS